MADLYIVGIGPGAYGSMTIEAADALSACPVIVGYTVYVDLIREHFPDKEYLTTPMRQEEARCRMALERAVEGTDTAVVCSGDSGVYGMAALILELLEQEARPGVRVKIIPGVTAALSGGALLGAPLANDFAVVSLSDLLTPLETIKKRVRAAAEGDFPLCIYNPSSRKRWEYLAMACRILLEYRPKGTVCGIASRIGREGQQMEVLTLGELEERSVDMFSTVFIGNSQTRKMGRYMVTSRGYRISGPALEHAAIGILGGTSEGRLLAEFCRAESIPAAVSVATSYGEELLSPGPFVRVHTGRMEKEELLAWIRGEKITALADATHPYARTVSENAAWACRQAGIPYERLVRGRKEEGTEKEKTEAEEMMQKDGRILRASTVEEAARMLEKILEEGSGEKGLITTGSKELAAYTGIPDYAERLYVRVLPSREGIDACLRLGWKGSHVIAMQGPFSLELNRALLDDLGITCMVTKESGKAGGFPEKIAGAMDAGCRVIVVSRPKEEVGKTLEEMKAWIIGMSRKNQADNGEVSGSGQARMQAHFSADHGLTVALAGIGTGGLAQITWEGLRSILAGDALLGAGRMVESGKAICRQAAETPGLVREDDIPPEQKAYLVSHQPDEMIAWLRAHPEIRRPVVLYSGDVGFYSGAAAFKRAAIAENSGLRCRLLPGIASISALSAITGRPWENAEIVSLHGRTLSGKEDWSLKNGRDRFLLLDGSESLHQVCRQLLEQGQEKARIVVGENLGYEEENITEGSPGEILMRHFGRLSCAWIIPWREKEPA